MLRGYVKPSEEKFKLFLKEQNARQNLNFVPATQIRTLPIFSSDLGKTETFVRKELSRSEVLEIGKKLNLQIGEKDSAISSMNFRVVK